MMVVFADYFVAKIRNIGQEIKIFLISTLTNPIIF